MTAKRVRKAVIPAAGMGTRFLPATKAVPKEMLPLVDKPLIQYGVEEAVAAGCTEVIIITSRGKTPMEDHFDRAPELECQLEARGKTELLEIARSVSNLAHITYTRQGEALGLGHAVLQAKLLVGDEPFAVILPDDIVDARVACMKQMVDAFNATGSSIIASEVIQGAGDPVLRLPRLHAGCERPTTARGARHGGKTQAGRGAESERHHWPLHPHATYLRDAGVDHARRRRRVAIDRRHQSPARV